MGNNTMFYCQYETFLNPCSLSLQTRCVKKLHRVKNAGPITFYVWNER